MATTLLVLFVAVMFAGMGLDAFRRPGSFLRWFDLYAQTPTARNEIQAVYGGFGVAMAVVLVVAVRNPAWADGILVAVGAALAGMAAGRLVGAVRERPGGWAWVFLGVEVTGSVVLLLSVGRAL